ncbi:Hypothetical predicted protein [Pelobates cultripes]|uniref:CD164 sialomucin-like 2 protein n=1 Tax=Pelobates cultripes TaxID=61616 RepID=A0AAD1R0V8_PELCU|nr:Hypothetical predicted protein [Pelobates cultripes]
MTLIPYKAETCRHLRSCESCTEGVNALNITCMWVSCSESENSSCVSTEEFMAESCLVFNTSSKCEDFLSPFIITPLSIPEVPPSNTLSPPVFHTGSFIGGGLLVIILQAIGYFVLKRLNGPERDYHTMEETAQ